MKKTLILSFIGLFLLTNYSLKGQGGIADRTVNVQAIVQESPAQIKLTWDNSSFAQSTEIFRKKRNERSFSSVRIGLVNAPDSEFIDNNVEVGQLYDYNLVQRTSFTSSNVFTLFAWGGISAGINIQLNAYRGDLLIVADTAIKNNLSAEFERFKDDLIEDGWVVSVVSKVQGDNVSTIKQKIKTWYNNHQAYGKSLILLGDIPVPYSGNFGIETSPPDGHVPDHNGAWAADVYYGIMNDGVFTDNATNVDGITRDANKNLPGDGKFDQSFIPGEVQLQVGRIDMSNLNAVGGNYILRSQNYLNKNHNFRNKVYEVPERYIFEDRLNLLGTEAPGRLHYFQSSNFHKDSLIRVSNTYFSEVKSKPTLFSGVTSTAGYSSINGVGNVNNFADPVYSVFSNYFGSYFADWDNTNNFLRGAIAGPGYTLTSIWSGRPVVNFHHMSLGANIGFSLQHAQHNNFYTGFIPFYTGIAPQSIHVSMHGDPTLRLHTLSPISNPNAAPTNNKTQVNLSWTASLEPEIDGYMIYRAIHAEGPYQAIHQEPITQTNYTDETPWKGDNYYMIRTIKKKSTPSGTYFNLSQGRRAVALDIDGDPNVHNHNLTKNEAFIKLYPNPSNGLLHIEIGETTAETKASIRTITGQEVANLMLYSGQNTTDLSSLPSGIYFIQISQGNKITSTKWVKYN